MFQFCAINYGNGEFWFKCQMHKSFLDTLGFISQWWIALNKTFFFLKRFLVALAEIQVKQVQQKICFKFFKYIKYWSFPS